MQFLKYLAGAVEAERRFGLWILRLRPQTFVIISESLAANLKKVRQTSVWQITEGGFEVDPNISSRHVWGPRWINTRWKYRINFRNAYQFISNWLLLQLIQLSRFLHSFCPILWVQISTLGPQSFWFGRKGWVWPQALCISPQKAIVQFVYFFSMHKRLSEPRKNFSIIVATHLPTVHWTEHIFLKRRCSGYRFYTFFGGWMEPK